MDRRQFCQSTLAASVAASYGFLAGCGRDATNADTSIAAVSLDGGEIELEKAALRELGDALQGPVLLADHAEYDGARQIWNGMHDKRPALIARCAGVSDVLNAVNFARDHDLLTAVRGGGHSFPGNSVCEGGLVLDLSLMKGIPVDPDTRRRLRDLGYVD